MFDFKLQLKLEHFVDFCLGRCVICVNFIFVHSQNKNPKNKSIVLLTLGFSFELSISVCLCVCVWFCLQLIRMCLDVQMHSYKNKCEIKWTKVANKYADATINWLCSLFNINTMEQSCNNGSHFRRPEYHLTPGHLHFHMWNELKSMPHRKKSACWTNIWFLCKSSPRASAFIRIKILNTTIYVYAIGVWWVARAIGRLACI